MILKIKVNNKPEIELPDFECVEGVRRLNGKDKKVKQIVMRGTNVLASEGKTWKGAKEAFNDFCSKQEVTPEKLVGLRLGALAKWNRNRNWDSNCLKLKTLLAVREIPYDRVCWCIFGDHVIDLPKLDILISTPENVTTKERVFEIGGQEAVDLVEAMI